VHGASLSSVPAWLVAAAVRRLPSDPPSLERVAWVPPTAFELPGDGAPPTRLLLRVDRAVAQQRRSQLVEAPQGAGYLATATITIASDDGRGPLRIPVRHMLAIRWTLGRRA
jgi:hypothetical protein